MNSESPNRQKQHQHKKENAHTIPRNVVPFLTMGFQLAAAVVLFLLLGHWIDNKFGISPIGKLVGVVLGTTGGFIKFFKTAAAITTEEKQQRVKDKREN